MIPKNPIEFNTHWEDHLEEGHYGLAISDPKVIAYLHEKFQKLKEKYPDFTYSQIKLKFGSARAYIKGVDHKESNEVEKHIEHLLRKVHG